MAPAGTLGPDLPVDNVSWCDGVWFANLWTAVEAVGSPGLKSAYLNANGSSLKHGERIGAERVADSLGYRLSTDTERITAARAGSRSAFISGDDPTTVPAVAWYDNADTRSHPVGQLQPNALGLYDMSGNVYELTESAFVGEWSPPDGSDQRVVRGSSFYESLGMTHLSQRTVTRLGWYDESTGVRLARTVP